VIPDMLHRPDRNFAVHNFDPYRAGNVNGALPFSIDIMENGGG